MAQLVNLRENLIQFYQKYEFIVRAVIKFALSFIILFTLGQMFDFGSKANSYLVFALVSLVQAFLPLVFLYFTGSLLIMLNLWQLSPDILAGFAMLFLIGCISLVRVDRKSAWIAMAIPVLFYLKLEYLAPVLLGITVGLWAVVPASLGILIYFISTYTESVSTLLTTTEAAGPAAGLQRIASLIVIDRYLLVMFAAYFTVILITALLNHLFYERAWIFAIVVGNAVLAVIILCGRYIFELDYEVWRVFLEVALSVLICVIYRFFRGIGDASRTERTVFEDDEYIYYVKAVPKLKVAQRDHNVKDIHLEAQGAATGKKSFELPPKLTGPDEDKSPGRKPDQTGKGGSKEANSGGRSGREDAATKAAGQENSTVVDPLKAGSVKEETQKAESAKEETQKAGLAKEGIQKAESAKEDLAKNEDRKTESTKEGPVNIDQAKEDFPAKEQSGEDSSKKQSAKGGASGKASGVSKRQGGKGSKRGRKKPARDR